MLFGIVKEETFLLSMGHTCSRESIAGGMPGTEDQDLWEISWLFFVFVLFGWAVGFAFGLFCLNFYFFILNYAYMCQVGLCL